MNRNRVAVFGALAAVGCMASLGCSDGRARIAGVVTLDGQPLAGDDIQATVVFEPTKGGAKAYATVRDGAYSATTGSSTGVEPGEYVVSVRGKRFTPSPDPNYPPKSVTITPERYASSATSGLRIDAKPGSQEFNVALTSSEK